MSATCTAALGISRPGRTSTCHIWSPAPYTTCTMPSELTSTSNPSTLSSVGIDTAGPNPPPGGRTRTHTVGSTASDGSSVLTVQPTAAVPSAPTARRDFVDLPVVRRPLAHRSTAPRRHRARARARSSCAARAARRRRGHWPPSVVYIAGTPSQTAAGSRARGMSAPAARQRVRLRSHRRRSHPSRSTAPRRAGRQPVWASTTRRSATPHRRAPAHSTATTRPKSTARIGRPYARPSGPAATPMVRQRAPRRAATSTVDAAGRF